LPPRFRASQWLRERRSRYFRTIEAQWAAFATDLDRKLEELVEYLNYRAEVQAASRHPYRRCSPPTRGKATIFALSEDRGVKVQIEDNGGGIDPETRERIFDPFFSTKHSGRGLGLSTVLGIVRGHGGAIAVQSKPDRGTTFRVLLPLRAY